MAVIVDVSQVVISGASIAYNSHKENLTESMIKNMFLNSIKSFRHKFIGKYGDPLILAWDGKDYWRKHVNQYYKAHRKAGREKSSMNWDLIFSSLDTIHKEINDYFPYYSIKVDGAEADDIISVFADYYSKNELDDSSMFETEPQKLLIISNDTDFLQLQTYKNVSQYSQMKRKLIKPKTTAEEFLIEKVIRGDAKDGITNIFSDPDTFMVEGKRQTSCMKPKVEEIKNLWLNNKELPSFLTEEQVDKFHQNYKLLCLSDLQLPTDIKDKIISQYENDDLSNRGTGTIHTYLVKNGMKNFLREINKF